MLKSENRGFRIAAHIVLGLFSLACVLPFVMLISASLTQGTALTRDGYPIIPSVFSLDAYVYIIQQAEAISKAFGISVLVTVVGTTLCLAVTTMLAYPLSRKDLPMRKFFSFFVVFTLLFNGGMVPTYLIYTQMLRIKNTLFALLIPSLITNGFIIMLVRTFFETSIPGEVLESARIDGAPEFGIFARIVLPMSLPILATVGLLQGLAYWNDWNNGLLYITNSKLYSLQNYLNVIIQNIEFLISSNLGGLNMAAGTPLPSESIRMAIAVIAVVPMLCAYPFFQKYFVRGMTLGAVKG